MLKGNEIVYQIFVRNYSKEGTFKKVEDDLPRIKDLGVNILYLMPIHEIGIKERKGTFGSPYAAKDYYSITPDYGTKEDLISLINKTHELGMKIIIDMVFNHTSPDSVLLKEHPEFYYYKNGKTGNRVGDWSDIIDLDTFREDTQDYLVEVLKYWVSLGIDGFRFDVASMICFDLFKKARKELGPDIIFIGESIDYGFVDYLESIGMHPTPDKDMFPVFDALYNYSWFQTFHKYLRKEISKETLLLAIKEDEELLKDKGCRLNCLENHDNERVASYVTFDELKDILDMFANIKGLQFIYMGQEYGVKHKPELFEKDPVIWKKNDKYLKIYKDLINKKVLLQ